MIGYVIHNRNVGHLGITILQANNTTTAQQVFFTTE